METAKNIKLTRQRGFNLVELMVALAIIGILSMVAYPSFMDSVRQSRRTDAHAALMLAANNLERWFSTNNTYTTNGAVLGLEVEDISADEFWVYSGNGHYLITVAAGASGIGSSYVITARPVPGDGQQNDDGCTVLTLDSAGRRTPDPNTSGCW